MANHKTGAQRYNDKMDKIFSTAKATMSETKNGKTYDHRYYRETKKGEIAKKMVRKSDGDKIIKRFKNGTTVSKNGTYQHLVKGPNYQAGPVSKEYLKKHGTWEEIMARKGNKN